MQPMASRLLSVASLLLLLCSAAAAVNGRVTCDRTLLSICYNQLQPFYLTNNLRRILRGITHNSMPRPKISMAGNKHSRSQAALALPLHRIFGQFREFCEIYSTFSECLDAHDALGCMKSDLVGEINKVVVTVTRRDRSNGAQWQPQSPNDLLRDFDHYRRLAQSFCVDTPENMKIHVVRCLAHAVSASPPLVPDSNRGWPDSELRQVDVSGVIDPSSADTCQMWLRQSQGPLMRSFFRQEGCGEHLTTAMRLSAFLSEMTMSTTNASQSIALPKYRVCGRHLPPKFFKTLINDTFHNLVSPPATSARPNTAAGSSYKQPISIEELIASNERKRQKTSYPVLSVAAPGPQEDERRRPRQQSNVIPTTRDGDSYEGGNDLLGVPMMLADSPNFDENRPFADNQRYSSSATASSVSALSLACLFLLVSQLSSVE